MQNYRMIKQKGETIPPGTVCAGVNVNGKLIDNVHALRALAVRERQLFLCSCSASSNNIDFAL